MYPIEFSGQPVATCSSLTELALDSAPEMAIWAFSAEGWARTWAVDAGSFEPHTRTAVQRDGSVRRIDSDGDMTMVNSDGPDSAGLDTSSASFQPYDGGNSPVEGGSPPGASLGA